MKETKVIELNATGLWQYLDQTNVDMVFAYLDNNSVFKTAYPSSTQNENKKDIEMVPKKREKSKLKKKTQSSRQSETYGIHTKYKERYKLLFEPFGDDYGFIYDPLLLYKISNRN